MGKYTRLPGMHEFAYNSWLFKVHNRINDQRHVADINSRFFKYRERNEQMCLHNKHVKNNERNRSIGIIDTVRFLSYQCYACDLFIYKSKIVERAPIINVIKKECNSIKIGLLKPSTSAVYLK